MPTAGGDSPRGGPRSTWPAAPTSPTCSRRLGCWALDQYFGPRIYGASDDYQSFSKAQVIERILRENEVDGAALLGFGDGYVEIRT